MNNAMKMGGLAVVACAACCAVSIVPALLAGGSVAIVSATAFWSKMPALAVLAVAVAALYFLSRRKAAAAESIALNMHPVGACGCGDACASGQTKDSDTKLPIACSLETGDLKDRIASIEHLSVRALRHAERTDLVLSLTYAREPLYDVSQVMRQEQSCCAFLDFELSHDDQSVYLRLTVPESARLSAQELFAHFTPTFPKRTSAP